MSQSGKKFRRREGEPRKVLAKRISAVKEITAGCFKASLQEIMEAADRSIFPRLRVDRLFGLVGDESLSMLTFSAGRQEPVPLRCRLRCISYIFHPGIR